MQEARRNIHALKLYGKVSVSKYDGTRLPYTNDFVNLTGKTPLKKLKK